MGKVLF